MLENKSEKEASGHRHEESRIPQGEPQPPSECPLSATDGYSIDVLMAVLEG